MHLACRITYSRFYGSFVFFRTFDCLPHIARVVKRIEYTYNIDTVFNGQTAETVDDVVGIVLVAEQILSAEQHLQLRIGKRFSKHTQSFPRVFVQITKARIESSSAPRFQSIITDFVEFIGNRKHFFYFHSRRSLRLMRVAKNRFHYFNLSHIVIS